jgi:hypothetical protein
MNILLAGEVDCVKSTYMDTLLSFLINMVVAGYSENPGPENYVELKTRKMDGERLVAPLRI